MHRRSEPSRAAGWHRPAIRAGVLAALAGALSCGPSPADAPTLSTHDPQQSAIWNGELEPTLYPEMSPWQQEAAVAVGTGWFAFCSGSLISARTVLTAGHCVETEAGLFAAAELWVRVGWDWTEAYAELDVVDIDYLDTDFDDIAVLTLAEPYLEILPLPVRVGSFDAVPGASAQAVGFGIADETGMNSLRYWGTLSVSAGDGWITATDVFIPVTGFTQRIDSGDSGGPLIFDFGDGPEVIGVASRGGELGGSVGFGYYAPVVGHQDWIAGHRFDDPACVEACRGSSCGPAAGCDCGACPRGHVCVAGGCAAEAQGSGGVCLGERPVVTACNRRRDCRPGETCFENESGAGTCGPLCTPEPCAADDPFSRCLPASARAGIENACVRPFAPACDDEGKACETGSGGEGVCRQLDGAGALSCYAGCEPAAGCAPQTGCVPATCEGSGGLEVCSLGCVPDCRWRECGEDGCGGSCGTCNPEERCGDYGRCVEDPDATAPVGGSPGDGDAPAPSGCVAIRDRPPAVAAALLLASLTIARRRRRR